MERSLTTPPINWEINDQTYKLLMSEHAPHETAGVLRIHRAGMPGAVIAKTFKYRGILLMRAMQKALNQEGEASRRRLPIHDALINIPKEKT